jgi:molybdenum cofactor guanylyltransferase
VTLAAAITAGGQSRRFGQDKALYEVGGVPLLHRVAASFPEHLTLRLLIAPEGRYTLSGWRTVPDLRPAEGPLAGLETALFAFVQHLPAGGCAAGGWLAFAATDLPNLNPEFWKLMVGATTEAGASTAAAQAVIGLDHTGRPQPLAALYHTGALPRVTELLDKGERRMGVLLEHLRVVQVPWKSTEDVAPSAFVNLNTPPLK